MLENDIKYEDEIDLKNLLHIAWSSKNFIVFFSLIFILTFYLISIFLFRIGIHQVLPFWIMIPQTLDF